MYSDLDERIQEESTRPDTDDRSEREPPDCDEPLHFAFQAFCRGYGLGTKQAIYRGKHPFDYVISSNRRDRGEEDD